MSDSGQNLPPMGVYVHVPFCSRQCDFCAFYKEKPDKSAVEGYLEALEIELEKWGPDRAVDTVFIGGGTPSLLNASDLGRLCGAIRRALVKVGTNFSKLEWTIEMAPSSVKPDKLELLKSMGVNRFSLGVQSFNPATLAAIGRPHNLSQIHAAIDAIKAAGIENWNMDLIFAAAEENLTNWLEDLKTAVGLSPKHISTYCLTFEDDTALFIKMLAGLKKKPTPDQEARFYESTWKFLSDNGFAQYEVSNFSRPGYPCVHNLNTWRMGEWLGYGPAGASQIYLKNKKEEEVCFAQRRDTSLRASCLGPLEEAAERRMLRQQLIPPFEGGVGGRQPTEPLGTQSAALISRQTNIPDLSKWAVGVKSGERALVDVSELTAEELAIDAVIFGLRMRAGVDLSEIQSRFVPLPERVVDAIENFVREGVMEILGSRIRLTDRGILVADKIAAEIL